MKRIHFIIFSNHASFSIQYANTQKILCKIGKKGTHNNTPFSIMETKQLNCQAVLQYYETKEKKTMRVSIQLLERKAVMPTL